MHLIALYDMDKTITRSPTWTPFLFYAGARLAPWRLALLPFAGLAVLGYAAQIIGRARLKEVTQALILGPVVDESALARVAEGFAGGLVQRGVFAQALAQIAEDRASGRQLVMATASCRFYVGAIAAALGFDAVVATESRHLPGGRVAARLAGENCYGPAKLDQVEGWFAGLGIARSKANIRFYSDHVSDAPTFEWADEAVAVNPHPRLRALALARGWKIVEWQR
ncbi:MAG: haloacid dehalogenase-like hydrolase [Sphingomonas sp.]